MLLLVACVHEDMNVITPGETEEENVTIEIFTRTQKFELPETRAGANDIIVDMTPFVLVFEINGTNIICVEAVKAYQLDGIDKRYVKLTQRSTGRYQFLILANNERSGVGGQQFWFQGNPYAWTEENIQILLNKELSYISNSFLTDKLVSPRQTEPPYSGNWNYLLPMTYLTAPVDGISKNTKIGEPEGVGNGPLNLIRSVAKISIINDPDRNWNSGDNPKPPINNFELTGIMSIGNIATQGKVYNYNDDYLSTVGITEIARENYNGKICNINIADWDKYYQTHWDDLIFINETPADNNTFFIIEGIFTTSDGLSTRYYYKMAALDNEQKPMNLKRNHLYEFTIRNVRGPGYLTIEEAISSPPCNKTILRYEVTTVDLSSHHIITNGNYYLGVSNSRYIAYTDTPDEWLDAFRVVTDFTRIGWTPIRNEIIPDSGIICDFTSIPDGTSSNQPLDVKIKFLDGTTSGSIQIWLGNLKLIVYVEYKGIVPAAGAWYPYYRYYKAGGNEWWEYNPYYLTSGTVDSSATSWIKLAPGSDEFPKDLIGPGPYYEPDKAILTNITDNVTSGHGKIQVYIDSNLITDGGAGQMRNGIFYLSTGYHPQYSPQNKVDRIKVYIKQLGEN